MKFVNTEFRIIYILTEKRVEVTKTGIYECKPHKYRYCIVLLRKKIVFKRCFNYYSTICMLTECGMTFLSIILSTNPCVYSVKFFITLNTTYFLFKQLTKKRNAS